MFSFLLSKYLWVELAGSYVNYVCIYKKLPNNYPQWLHHTTLPSAMYKNFSCSTFSLTLGKVSHFNFSHFSKLCGIVMLALICISIQCPISIWKNAQPVSYSKMQIKTMRYHFRIAEIKGNNNMSTKCWQGYKATGTHILLERE